MKRVFLLTGVPGSGKTTAIRKILSRLSCTVGGFYTEEIREGSQRTGFRLVTLDGRQGVMARTYLRGVPRIGKYGVDLTVVEGIGVDSLNRALRESDVVVIDEIGPMELLSSHFKQVVLEILESDIVLLGSIVKRQTEFSDRVKRHSDVQMIEITRENRDQIPFEVLSLIQQTGQCGAVGIDA